jgi:hypothetical protein
MIGSGRQPSIELTTDPFFAHRVRRLVWISSIALGVIALLAIRSDAPGWSIVMLVAGWVLMPMILALSLRRPKVRYGLVIPASLVTLGLLGPVTVSIGASLVGWVMILVGILVGATLGMWFWYRWLPVPHGFNDPYGARRMVLIGAHIGLVLFGVAVVFNAA